MARLERLLLLPALYQAIDLVSSCYAQLRPSGVKHPAGGVQVSTEQPDDEPSANVVTDKRDYGSSCPLAKH